MRCLSGVPTSLAVLVTAALAIDLKQETMTGSTTNTTRSEDLLRIANEEIQKLNPLLDYQDFNKAIDDYEFLLTSLSQNFVNNAQDQVSESDETDS